MLKFFNTQWDELPITVLDVETTGKTPGLDRTVQVGVVRFERREVVGTVWSYINPGVPIPAEVTAIHGVTDKLVIGAPELEEYFTRPDVRRLVSDAQPCAYNAGFDQRFLPPLEGIDWDWPWIDPLVLVRKVDKWAPGKGRHKLQAACDRLGVALTEAHSAEADARAAGQLFYKLGRANFPKPYTMGRLLIWQRRQEAEQWGEHMTWRSTLPPMEEES
jgi:DNA polymerase III alpha subunit (gram-positive type)